MEARFSHNSSGQEPKAEHAAVRALHKAKIVQRHFYRGWDSPVSAGGPQTPQIPGPEDRAGTGKMRLKGSQVSSLADGIRLYRRGVRRRPKSRGRRGASAPRPAPLPPHRAGTGKMRLKGSQVSSRERHRQCHRRDFEDLVEGCVRLLPIRGEPPRYSPPWISGQQCWPRR